MTGLDDDKFTWTVEDTENDAISGAHIGSFTETGTGTGVYTASLTTDTGGDHVVRLYADGAEVTDSANPLILTFTTAPGMPTSFSVTQGDGTLRLDWIAPADDGGGAISAYEYSLDEGDSFTSINSTAVTFAAATLTNGQSYEVQVRAANAAGAGAATDTITATPAAADAGSLYDSATCSPILASDPNVTLSGATPTSDGSGGYLWSGTLTFAFTSPLDLVLAPHPSSNLANFEGGASYAVDVSAGGWVQTLGDDSITYGLSGATISGAQDDADAGNAPWGHFDAANVSTLTLTSGGNEGDAFTICRIPAAPEAPTNLSVTPGDGELTLSWDAPLDDGGPDISAYKYNLDGGSTYTAFADTATTQSVSVANGAAYTVTVLARNDVDDGAASAAVTVPSVTLGAGVSGVVGGTFTVTATFSEPVTGFGLDDVSVTNATKDNFATTGTVTTDPDTGADYSDTYTFEVTPTSDATEVSVDVAAGVALTTAGAGNTTALQLSRTADLTAPQFTSGSSISSPENTSATVATLTATDTNGPVTYAITGGDDQGDFVLTSAGALTFNTDGTNGAADYEAPADADANNVYTVEVTASDAATPANTRAQTLTVTVINVVENPALLISAASVSLDESGESNSDTFTVALAEEPSANVTVTVSTDDVDAASVSEDGGTTQATSVELTFTTSDWNVAQTVTVTGVRDDDTSDESPSISVDPSGGGYDSVATASVSVSVTDTSVAGLTVSESSLSINESGDGNSGSFTVVLDTIPTGTVTVAVTSSDEGAATVSATSLTFTTSDWNVAQTVTVTGVSDDDTSDESPSISVDPSGGGYDDVAAGSVGVTVSDTSVAGLTLSASDLTVDESGDGNSGSFTVVLDTIPTGTVTVAVTSSDEGAATVSATSLTFTTSDWNVAQTVTVTGVADDDTSDESLSISLTPSGGGYDNVAAGSVGVTVSDTSVAGLTLSASDLTIDESGDGNSGSFTVVLDTIPTGTVTVAVTSSDEGAATVSATSLTFTTSDWNVAQTVTVTGVADDDTSDESLSISVDPSGGGHDDVAAGSVGVTVTDTSVAGLTLSASDLTIDESGDGNSGSFTVVLDTIPTGTVTVAVTSSDTGAATVSATSLTFTTSDWNVAQTVTVTGVSDDDTSDESPSISVTPSGGGYDDVAAGSVDVAVTDTSVAGLTLSASDLTIDESGDGNSDSFTVVLDTIPTGTVTVAVTSSDTGAVTVSATSLTFTTSDWNVAQTVTVRGVTDHDVSDESPSISVDPSGGGYDDVAAGSVGVTVTDTSVAGLTLSASDLTIDEDGDGNSGSFTAVLDTIPTGTVTVAVTSSDEGAATVSATSLTFTTSDWNVAQTVTVTGVSDDDTSDESLSISVDPSGGGYDDVAAGSVGVTVSDTSVAGLTLSASDLTIDESGDGNSDSFTVVLDTIPTGTVTVAVTSSDEGAATVSATSLTFTTSDWDVAQTVTVAGVSDDDTSDESPSISVDPSGGGYDDVAAGSVGVTVTDTSVAGLTVSESSLSIDESGDGNIGSFTVVLDTIPTGTVTVAVTPSDEGAATVSATSLTFTTSDWDVAQTVTVTGVSDDDTSDESVSISVTPSGGGYDSVAAGSVGVTVKDTSVAGLTVSESSLSIDESGDGSSDSFTVVLDTIPTGDVTVAVASDDAGAATVSTDELTFTATNWNTAQTVTVTGALDDDVDDESGIAISINPSGGGYDSVATASVSVSVTDTSVAGLTVSESSLSINESGDSNSGSFTVVLDTIPTANVTVAVTSDDTGAATVSATSLTFTTENWNTAQTVTVTGVSDDDTSDESPSISVDPSGGGYDDVAAGSVGVTVTDTSVAGLTLSASDLTIDESGDGNSGSFTVVLDTIPTGTVTVAVTSSDEGAAMVSVASLTFTTSDWNVAQTVTVTGVTDHDVSDESLSISVTPAGGGYDSVAAGSVGVTVTDTSVAGLTVSESSLSINESGDGNSATFTVVLDTIPAGTVTVAVTSSDEGAVTVSATSLTFTTSDWNVAQTVTVTGVSDDDTSDESPSISVTPSGGGYDDVAAGSVGVTVTDTSVAGLTLSASDLTIDESGDGNSGSFTVVLDTIPTGDVTVALVSSDEGAAAVSATSFTFTTSDWNVAQTVTVTGVADDDTSDESLSISVDPSGGGYDNVAAGSVGVTVKDTSVAGLTVSESGLSIDESGDGNSGSFTVVLDTIPTGDVTVALASSDEGAATVSATSLTFTTSDWDVARTVTVAGVSDDDVSDESLSISVTPSGGGYDDVAAGSVGVTVKDTSVAGLTLSASDLTIDEDGNGNSTTFTVVLDTIPTGTVTVAVTSSDTGAATVSATTLTFTTSDWNEAQTITVTGVSDDNSADESVSINLTPSGGGYGQDQAESLSVSVTDDDIPSLVLSVETLTISESQTAEFKVALRTQPSGDVTVALATSEDEIVTLVAKADASDHVTFTTETWNTPQAVVATAVDNSILGNGSATLTLTAASTADADYNSLDPSQVSVSVEDDEVAGFVLSQSSLSLDEGTETSFTVALGGKPSQDVTVSLSSSNEAAATVTPASLTFTLTDWDSAQSVTLTSIDNAEAADVSLRVTLAASGAEFAGITQDLSVTIIDNDVQAQPEDSGALVSSIATSGVMSAQLGSLVSDAAIGGLSSAAGPAGTAPSPGGGSAASGDDSVASLDTSAYSRLHVLSAREGDQMPLVDWFSTGLSNASVDAELKGDGDFGYAVVGTELDKNETSVSGLLYGAEASSWNYEGETDVDRAGVSIGYYSARREGGLIYTGSSILTASRNEFESVSDATGNASSLRLILKGEISGWRDLEDGSRLTPFVDLLYSTETLESFKFSDGVSSDQAEASLGRLGLGVEYMTMPLEDMGRITLRGELSQVFGAEDVTLNDGTVYSPNEDPVGAISVGWIGNNDDGSTTRIDLTFGELGNGENEEVRIDGTWDRSF